MTPKLIRSVAAACLAAALLPAQEEHDVIVRVKSDESKASAKKSALKDKKMVALLEKLADTELSNADRKKVAAMLKKMLAETSGVAEIEVVAAEKKPTLRWAIDKAKGGDATAKERSDKVVQWLTLTDDVKKAKAVAKLKEVAKLKDVAKIKELKANDWVEVIEEVHHHGGHAHEGHGDKGKRLPSIARVITTKGGDRAKAIARFHDVVEHGHGAGGKVHVVESKPRAIARLADPEGRVAYVRTTKGDADEKPNFYFETVKQDPKRKDGTRKSGDLGARAKQLRVRLLEPDEGQMVVEYVQDPKSGKASKLEQAKKAYEEAKKRYAAAKKAHGKVVEGKRLYGTVVAEDWVEAKKMAEKGRGKVVFDKWQKVDGKDGSVYFFDRAGKAGDKKGQKGEARYLFKKGDRTYEYKPRKEVFEYRPDAEDVRVYIKDGKGRVEAVKPIKAGKKADGYTFEWTTEAGVDVFGPKSGKKSKAKKENSFTFEGVPEGAWHVDGDGKGTFWVDTRVKEGKKKGTFFVDTTVKQGQEAKKAKKAKTTDKGSFVFDTLIDRAKAESHKSGKVIKLKKGDNEAHGVWVVGDDEGKSGTWITAVPSIDKEALEKLMKAHKGDGKHDALLHLLHHGKDGGKEGHGAMLKLLERAHAHQHGGNVEVEVEVTECPALQKAHAHQVEVVVEECEEEVTEEEVTEECEECEEVCEECEDEGEAEVLKMIEQMRKEMAELRQMMQEIRGSLSTSRISASGTKATQPKVLTPVLRRKDVQAQPVRVLRRKTR